MAKNHTSSTQDTTTPVTHQHGDYVTTTDQSTRITNSKKITSPTSP